MVDMQSASQVCHDGEAAVMSDLLEAVIEAHEGPFGAAGRRSAFTPERVAIETDDGTVRTPDGRSLPEPRFVSIDLSEIAFT
jgi:pyrrolidone-carboxylate peptidase